VFEAAFVFILKNAKKNSAVNVPALPLPFLPSNPSSLHRLDCHVPLGFLKWMTSPLCLNIFASSMPGMLVTPSFFNVAPSFLSSAVEDVLCCALRFRRTVPLPPVLTFSAPPKRLAIMRARAASISSAILLVLLLRLLLLLLLRLACFGCVCVGEEALCETQGRKQGTCDDTLAFMQLLPCHDDAKDAAGVFKVAPRQSAVHCTLLHGVTKPGGVLVASKSEGTTMIDEGKKKGQGGGEAKKWTALVCPQATAPPCAPHHPHDDKDELLLLVWGLYGDVWGEGKEEEHRRAD